jgi:predicted transcriptional regulator
MEQSKIKRLNVAGWKAGSAQEFLGLSDAEAGYIDLHMRLSDAVRLRRQAARLSQSALANLIETSQSRIAKMEANDSTVSLDLLIRCLMSMGANLDELARIISFNDQGKNNRRTGPKKAAKSR